MADQYTNMVSYGCGNHSEYRNGSDFQRNLNKVMKRLVKSAYSSGQKTSSVGDEGSSSTVYGLVQCSPNLEHYECHRCASMAQTRLLQICNGTSGDIRLNGCRLSYGVNPVDFASVVSSECQNRKYRNGSPFHQNLNKLLESLVGDAHLREFSGKGVEGKGNNTVQGAIQCQGDLEPKACKQCALTAKAKLVEGCHRTSGFIQLGGCNLSYNYNDISSILAGPVQESTPAPSSGESPRLPGESPGLPGGKNRSGQSPSLRPQPKKGPAVSKAKVLEITLGAITAVIVLIVIIGTWHRMWHFSSGQISGKKGHEIEISGKKEGILAGTEINPELIFKYDILREATSKFKLENRLGEGAFGGVYKGVLPDGREVAVKRLKQNSSQQNSSKRDAEFLNEANLISRAQHKNVVKLLGCSVKSSERLLVYEYFPIGSLHNLLFGTGKSHLLDWKVRFQIIVGIAQGLQYLHEECSHRIVHRDIKPSNILLDDKYIPKIADFGLAKLFAEDQSRLNTRAAGTIGHIAPEYASGGQLTNKADVYSFGVLLLEIISGRKPCDDTEESLLQRTWRLYQAQTALEVMDPRLEGSYTREEGIRVIKIGLLCTQAAASRPSMSDVVWMLTKDGDLPSPIAPESEGKPDLTRPDVHSAGKVNISHCS